MLGIEDKSKACHLKANFDSCAKELQKISSKRVTTGLEPKTAQFAHEHHLAKLAKRLLKKACVN